MQEQTPANYAHGALYGLAAVCIWAAFIVVSRFGVRTSLTPWDITAIRYSMAGLLLFPYLASKGLAIDRLGWLGLLAIIVGCGAPPVLLVNAGLLFAPAAHAGALYPGVSPLIVVVLAAIFLGDRITFLKWIGFILIAGGAFVMVWGSGAGIGTKQNIGDAMFLAAGLAWACFTVVMKRPGLDGLHAASIAAVGSLIFYLPPYVFATGAPVLNAPLSAIALQAVIQGVLTAIIALLFYGRAVAILGASGGAAFLAFTPVVTGMMAMPILGEWPTASEWLSIMVISVGVYILSGGRLPASRGQAVSKSP
jgi:drug/metabolite transporter (DMT)-like permease